MADNHFFIVLASLILVYFLWMDLALYYKLQSGWGDLLVVQTYENLNVSSGPPSDSSSVGGAAAAPSTHRQISSSSLSPSSSSSAPTTMAFFDPFNPISVKLLMVDHANHYIYYSLTWWIDTHLLHIADKLLFISPDMISMSHVAVAACGARLIVSDSIYYRRIGVVLFEMRSMLDSYDGMVARARAHKRALTQANGGWGYWMDGICDAIGTVLFFVGAWVLLQKRRGSLAGVPRRRSIGIGNGLSSKKSSSSSSLESLHKPTSSSSPSSCNPVSPSSALSMSTLTVRASASTDNLIAMEEEASPFIASPSSPSSSAVHHCYGEGGGGGGGAAGVMRAATVTVLALLGQQFISSLLWNRYMHGFHELLEVPYKVMMEQARDFQVSTLKSSPFWIISWSWKMLNPHSLTSVLLCFVFFDCAGGVFAWLRYLGYLPIAALGLFSEVYMQTIMWHSLSASSASPVAGAGAGAAQAAV